MSRLGTLMETRYSLWQAIPAVYRSYPEELARQLRARLAEASGADLERLQAELDTALAVVDGEEQDFFAALVSAFDAVLAPVHASVEDLDLYLDPRTCPPDFLPWLSGWLGLALNERWPINRRREFVARAVEIFKLRGTVSGIRQAVELYTGITPVVEDNGGTAWSPEPLGPLPGSPMPHVTVILPGSVGATPIDPELVHGVVGSVKPAHVSVEVKVG